MTSRREFLHWSAGLSLAAAGSQPSKRAVRPAGLTAPPTVGGRVETVLGPIDADQLGFTLPHEHIFAGSTGLWQAWPELLGGRDAFIAKVVERLKTARAEGVRTVVDVSPIDVGRDVRLLAEVSRRSGMQIVAATGHWLAPSLSMGLRTTEELTDFFTLEIRRGIEGTGIKPGVIKVATDQEGVTPFLDKALRAAARTSKATGVPITTHTFAAKRIGEKQAEIFEQEGADPARICLGHCDDSTDLDYLTGLAKRGYTLGMDHLTWGARPGGPTWQERAETIKRLIDAGFADRLFLSNDWYFGLSIAPTGTMEVIERSNPDGMLFTNRKILPELRRLGVPEGVVRQITVDNPRRLFGGA